jgi:hypothetical protein
MRNEIVSLGNQHHLSPVINLERNSYNINLFLAGVVEGGGVSTGGGGGGVNMAFMLGDIWLRIYVL